MIRMLADTRGLGRGTARGIGVDENTALVVTHADTNRASGQVGGLFNRNTSAIFGKK